MIETLALTLALAQPCQQMVPVDLHAVGNVRVCAGEPGKPCSRVARLCYVSWSRCRTTTQCYEVLASCLECETRGSGCGQIDNRRHLSSYPGHTVQGLMWLGCPMDWKSRSTPEQWAAQSCREVARRAWLHQGKKAPLQGIDTMLRECREGASR